VSEVIPGIRQSDPEIFEIYGRVALTGIPERFETYVESLGMWFSISAYSPQKEHFVAVFDVITERKRTEEALQLSESRFRLLSGTAGQLLASQNPQTIVKELCLQVMEHLSCHAFFNFLVDESVGKLHLNACAGIPEGEARNIEWLDYGVAVCGCVAREGKRIVAENIFNTPDIRTDLVKSYGIQAYACHPLEVQGKLIGTLSFGTKTKTRFSDEDLALMKTVADQVATAMEKLHLIDELRNSRDELELRVQERTAELKSYMTKLEQSNQALQDFASIASHDLQEPLRKVAAFGNMLKQKCGGSLEDHGKDYLERILNANQRMQSLLTGLLNYSRVTTQAKPFKEVDLANLIDEVISDLELRIVKTGGEVHVETFPVISADPTQMRQLFQNLIGNALKFHKPGEKPVVQVRSISNTDSGCQIIVEDNGIGFDEQYLERIFAPFQRLHGRSEYEGTGMGLAICKKIVERHGGSITAKSTPGEGATFIIELPSRQAG
jgi:signal transduction histidine kinase